MIAVERLSVRSGGFSLQDISFQVAAGSWCVLMGKTGSGKTTLLEAICGLRHVTGGRVLLAERDVTCAPPAARGIGYVPQDKALFTTMTVRENLGFALTVRGWNRHEINSRVNELATLLGITPLLERYPARLSGGEAQRIALGRALAARPAVLCLDEPLSALDDETRDEMHSVLRALRHHTTVTTLHITHHVADAQKLADQVLFLSGGTITLPAKSDVPSEL